MEALRQLNADGSGRLLDGIMSGNALSAVVVIPEQHGSFELFIGDVRVELAELCVCAQTAGGRREREPAVVVDVVTVGDDLGAEGGVLNGHSTLAAENEHVGGVGVFGQDAAGEVTLVDPFLDLFSWQQLRCRPSSHA